MRKESYLKNLNLEPIMGFLSNFPLRISNGSTAPFSKVLVPLCSAFVYRSIATVDTNRLYKGIGRSSSRSRRLSSYPLSIWTKPSHLQARCRLPGLLIGSTSNLYFHSFALFAAATTVLHWTLDRKKSKPIAEIFKTEYR